MLRGAVLLLAAAFSLMTAAEHPPLDLTAYHARYLNHRAEIRWALEDWPQGLVGFQVKIAARLAPDQPFRDMSDHTDFVVRPDGSYAYAQQAYLARVMEGMTNGTIHEIPEILQRAAVGRPGLTHRIRAVWEDADTLAQWGFARILPTVLLGAEHRVTLLPRWSDGLGQPVATMTFNAVEERHALSIQGFTMSRSESGGLVGHWSISQKAWEAAQGDHCRLQVSENLWDLESGWQDLPGEESGEMAGDQVRFSWMGTESEMPTFPVWFRVVPVVLLQSGVAHRLPPGPVVRLLPGPPPVPCDVQATWTHGAMEVRWALRERPQGPPALRAFRLSRQSGDDPTWQVLAHLEPDILVYRDQVQVPAGGQASYRYRIDVEQEGYDGAVLGGCSMPRTAWNLPPLPKPVIAESLPAQENGHAGYRLKWQIPQQNGEHLILQTRWSTTWDTARIEATPTGCFVPYDVTPAGQVLTLRVLVRREADGAEAASDPVRLVSWRMLPPDPVETVTAKQEGPGLRIEWRSSNSHGDVGFEIRRDGEVVIPAKDLGPWERRAWIPVATMDQPVTVSVRAVLANGLAASAPVEVQASVDRHDHVRLPAPRSTSYRGNALGPIEAITLWHDEAKTQRSAVYHLAHLQGTDVTLPHGLRETWDAEGRRQARLVYQKGSLHGLQRWWFPDGTLANVAWYDQDDLQPWTPKTIAAATELDEADRAWIAAHAPPP